MNDEEVKQQAQLENSPDTDDMGAIKVADEVLSIVAGLAASEVNGVYGMSGASGKGSRTCWANRISPRASRSIRKAIRCGWRSM